MNKEHTLLEKISKRLNITIMNYNIRYGRDNNIIHIVVEDKKQKEYIARIENNKIKRIYKEC